MNEYLSFELRVGRSNETDFIHVDEEEGSAVSVDAKVKNQTSILVKPGINFNGHLSVYFLAGVSSYGVTPSLAIDETGGSGSDSNARVEGVPLGLGLEYAFNNAVFLAFDFKSFSPCGDDIANIKDDLGSMSLGIGYRF